jgi:hypothetical protein
MSLPQGQVLGGRSLPEVRKGSECFIMPISTACTTGNCVSNVCRLGAESCIAGVATVGDVLM